MYKWVNGHEFEIAGYTFFNFDALGSQNGGQKGHQPFIGSGSTLTYIPPQPEETQPHLDDLTNTILLGNPH